MKLLLRAHLFQWKVHFQAVQVGGFVWWVFFSLDVFLGLSSQAKGGETNNTSELQLAYGVVISGAEQGLDGVSHVLEENPKQWRW